MNGREVDPIPGETDIEAVDPSPVHRAVLERSELARFLRPSAFPADKAALISVARDERATDAVLDELAALPDDGQWATPAAVWESLGHGTEHRVTERELHPEEAEPKAPELSLADAAIGVGVALLELGAVLIRQAERSVRTILRVPSIRH